MKTCCVCRRPDVRWPLSIVCHWCLQGEINREIDAIATMSRIRMLNGVKLGPRQTATVTPSGKIVLGARP